MGTYCCKSEEQEQTIENTGKSDMLEVEPCQFITIPYNPNNNNNVFRTVPPCWFGKHCPCPCHRDGKCVFK
jgi:hypothetical protein